MKQSYILVVDDEDRIVNFLRAKLKASGYEVLTARNGREAIEQAKVNDLDIIILDIVMPKLDGFETLKELRTFSSVPVIVLSARDSDMDKIKGLNFGADDYLTKPFNPEEVVARIEAIRRRMSSNEKRKSPEAISLNGLAIDFDTHRVAVEGKPTELTPIEWQLISELALNAGRLLTYEHLLTQVWGPEYRDDVQILRTWMSRLRSKIETNMESPRIQTVSKTGYILNTSEKS